MAEYRLRMLRACVGVGVAIVAAAAAPARAQLHRADPVIVPAPAATGRADDAITRTLVLDRCVGGCTITGTGGGATDAVTNATSIPPGGTYTLAAFEYSDAEWQAILTCVQQVYSPYAIAIVDSPPSGVVYNKTFVAGQPTDIEQPSTTLGIALLTSDCHPLSDSIAFAFANAHPHDATFVDNVCWTVAQESAHLYGLDHEYVFTDGVSACSDPMTYRGDCNGEKFFRPHEAYCGTVAQAPCRCGDAQSSHRLLLERFGAATPTTAPPVVALTSPTVAGPIADGAAVVAHASAQRGVDHVDLVLNGFAWATEPGVAFGISGQPAADYTLALPADVPDGIIDLQVIAYDDLGAATATPVLTMTKGDPCVSAATCAAHQACDGGRCAWSAATATLGDACTYPQECASGLCAGSACTQACDIDDSSTCPAHFGCDGVGSNTDGICTRTSADAGGGGCCDGSGGGGGALLAALVLAALVRSSRS